MQNLIDKNIAHLPEDKSLFDVSVQSRRPAQGKEIAYLVRTMEENGYPVAAAVSPDGETLCLSSVSKESIK